MAHVRRMLGVLLGLAGLAIVVMAQQGPPPALDVSRYVGLYEQPDRSPLLVWSPAEGQLAFGFGDGEVRGLIGRDDSFTYGPSLGVVEPTQGRVRFIRSLLGRLSAVEWTVGERTVRASRVDLREQDVTFAGGVPRLGGTLFLPPDPKVGVVFLHGSGPESREPSRVFAYLLAQRGVASLVFDKRSVGASLGDTVNVSFAELAADAQGALARLRAALPANTPVGYFGPSQGGWVAIAASALPDRPDFLVLQSGDATSPFDQVMHQTEQFLRVRNRWPAEQQAEAAAFRRFKYRLAITGEGAAEFPAVLAAARTKPWFDDITEHLPNATFWKANGLFDPMPVLRAYRGPVLAAFGANDINKDIELNARLLREALAGGGHPASRVEVIANANHGLFETNRRAIFDREVPYLRRLSPAYLALLTTWIPERATSADFQVPAVTLTPARIQVGGSPVDVELGEFQVAQFHARADSARMPLRFLRLKSRSETPGPPIVYLAGGPGASGIAAAGRPLWWPLFNSLRDTADVILLDQRGTGRSGSLPECTTGDVVPDSMATTRENFIRVFAMQVRHCREFWSKSGVDLAAYTTRESAADVDALRRALGVPQLDLLAVSYGTHLALAALKYYPASFRSAVLIGAEGLDDTVKDPQLTDAYFARVQASINEDPAARVVYPDVAAMMRRVIARAAANPVPVAASRGPAEARILLGDFELQRLAADRLGDPSGTANVLAAFAAADRGDWSTLGSWAQRQTGEPIFLSPMPLAMDAASGISATKRARVRQAAPSTILGDALGYPVLHADGTLDDLDLGDDFRSPFRSPHRALIISGTLDGRTYPEAHRDIAAMFTTSVFVRVINGGHSVMTPEIQQRIRAFFQLEPVSGEPIVVPAPRWVPAR